MNQYIGILILALFSAGFAVTMLALSYLLGPKSRSLTKQLPFECGSVSIGAASEQRFSVRYYLVAVLFILFDIEVIFLYPWVATLVEVGWPSFVQMTVFILVLSIGLAYVWRKGVLDWNKE